MASKVSIANGALQLLGATRIESLDQDRPNAKSMKAAFDTTRDALLRRYDWAFAIKRDSIAADGDDTEWGDWHRYALPNDHIKLILDDESGQKVDWRIEGRFIVTTDGAPLNIRYIARITDVNLYDPLFVEALEAALALACCEEITQSNAKMDRAQKAYDDAVAEAKRIGAIEKPAQAFPEDDWVNARL